MNTTAELIVENARLWTGGATVPADAIALAAGRVLALGRSADIARLAGSRTRRVDARGATVTPGLTDAHLHLLAWARAAREVDLTGCADRAEALIRVARFAAEHPEDAVVMGRGWEDHAWNERPERAALDAVCGDRPVLLHAKDFHTLWVNGAALAGAGIHRGTPDPAGGRIERDAAGEATGILREHAVRLCAGLTPAQPASDRELLRPALRRLHAFGVTAIHDFEGADAWRALRAVTAGPSPELRVVAHLPHAGLDQALGLGLESGVGDDSFRIGALKLFADGTLGSRTAALLEPYAGDENVGLELIPPAELAELVRRAFAGGFSVAIHAIGDRACRSALDAFERSRAVIEGLALPPRIEHVQLLDDADAARFALLGVAASMQPLHCAADAEIAERGWGARVRRSYPWRTLRDRGALLAFGSDAPVERPSVAEGLAAAISREARSGRSFVPEQRLTLDEALDAYTRAPARLGGAWPRLGSLEPGAHADLVVWNSDLATSSVAEIRAAFPVMTTVAGRIVYERDLSEAAPRSAVPATHQGRVRA